MENTYTINAKNKSVGRIATEAASILLGKHKVDFIKNNVSGDPVSIENADSIRITDKKLTGTKFTRYSGYPGGLKFETAQDVINKIGRKELIRRAVYNMLPNNKLRTARMKMLNIT